MFTEKLLKWLNILDKNETLIKIKRWLPYWDNGYFWGPVMLVQKPGLRSTITPRLDRHFFISIFKR